MKHTTSIVCVVLTAIAMSGGAGASGLFKCVDARGHISYQDVNCGPNETRGAITGDYANWLSTGVSPGNKRLVSSFEAQQKKAHQQRLKRIGDSLRQMRKQAQRCRDLKARYYQSVDRAGGSREPRRQQQADLLDRMRKACSD